MPETPRMTRAQLLSNLAKAVESTVDRLVAVEKRLAALEKKGAGK